MRYSLNPIPTLRLQNGLDPLISQFNPLIIAEQIEILNLSLLVCQI
jgi:hypothetical protein